MTINLTTVRDIVDPLQFVVEGTSVATYAVTPASPAFTAAGINMEINLDQSMQYEEILALGMEDIADSVKTGESYAFSLKSNIFNSALFKRGINAAGGGAGTIDEHLTFTYTKNVDGVKTWTKMAGCRAINTTLSVNRSVWALDMTFHCKEIFDEVTADPFTTPTYAIIPTTQPWDHSGSVANPFTWNAIATPERSFSLNVVRNLSLMQANQSLLDLYSKAATRRITANVEVWKKASTFKADFLNHTKRAWTYSVNSAPSLITGVDGRITGYREGHVGGSPEGMIEFATITSKSVSTT